MNKMARDDSDGMHMAVSQIGDRWTLLILWASLHGTTRFDDFQIQLGVARNILSDRLSKLVGAGILVKRPFRPLARRMEYKLTAKGEALRPTVERIEAWGRNAPAHGTGDGMGPSYRQDLATRR